MGSLRYPGGEKADGLDWQYAPDPILARLSPSDWPASDTTFYNLSTGSFTAPPMNFDQFMDVARQTNAAPNVVLSYDSANRPPYPNGVISSLEDLKVRESDCIRAA